MLAKKKKKKRVKQRDFMQLESRKFRLQKNSELGWDEKETLGVHVYTIVWQRENYEALNSLKYAGAQALAKMFPQLHRDFFFNYFDDYLASSTTLDEQFPKYV